MRNWSQSKWLTGSRNLVVPLLALAFFLATGSARAQSGNQSDATSISVTSSDGVGGLFSNGTAFSAGFSSSIVQRRVNEAAAALTQELAQGTLILVPLASTQSVATGAVHAQRSFSCLFSPAGESGTCASSIVSAISPNPAMERLAADLVSSVRDMMTESGVDATQFAVSVNTFNAFVQKVPESYLISPPDEFTVIHTVLSTLIEAADSAK